MIQPMTKDEGDIMSMAKTINKLVYLSAANTISDEQATECVECGEDKLPEFACPSTHETCVACCECTSHQDYL